MNAQEAVAAQLEPGETLVWAEAADAGAIISDMAPQLAFLILFNAMVWFAVVALVRTRDRDAPDKDRRQWLIGAAFTSMFVIGGAFGLYVVGSQMLSASSTAYGLTDRRVLIVREFPVAYVQSYSAEAFTRMLTWEDNLEFDYAGSRKGSDYNARLYVRDPEGLARRIRETLTIDGGAAIPD